jgi:ferredoxin
VTTDLKAAATMNLTIDVAKCCGSGQCVMAAPDVFDQDDDGVAFLLDQTPPDTERANVDEAIASCPTGAITVVDG